MSSALSMHLYQSLHFLALFRIVGAEVKDQTGGYNSHAQRKAQVDGGRFVEPWRVCKEPGGHDATDVTCGEDESKRGRAAVMRLYVVRNPRGEGGSATKTAYYLEKQHAVAGRFVM